MYLFILESIGTAELIMIGIVALMFLGPRKLPEMARKIGKLMAEFRSTTSDFKQTWEREVNFDEEAKALRLDDDEPAPIARNNSILNDQTVSELEAPLIKEIDPAAFKNLPVQSQAQIDETTATDDANDKKNWL